tara:strand:+ start:743 stop:1726 length:984 start_codon:yes stop_codon:yes gene_type:complete
MSVILDANYSSRQIYISSDDADRQITGTSDVIFNFKDTIQVPQGINIMISVVSAQIPVGFYAVASGRNLLSVEKTISGITTSQNITIPQGNYNINELVNYINSQTFFSANNTTFAYSTEANNITLTLTDPADSMTIKEATTIGRFIGFSKKDHTTVGGKVVGDKMVNVSGVNAINIATNFSTRNLDSRHQGFSNIIARVPVDKNFNNIIFYEPTIKFSSMIVEKEIKFIRLTLEDDTALNVLNMNGLDWSMVLQLDFVLDKNIDAKLKEFTKRGIAPKIAKYSQETQEMLRKQRQRTTQLRRAYENSRFLESKIKSEEERLEKLKQR